MVGPQNIDINFFQQDLGRAISGTNPGQWADLHTLRKFTITVSGTINAGTWDLLVCNLIDKPADSDNAHPSMQMGPSNVLGQIIVEYQVRYVKFVTFGVTGSLNCGVAGLVQTL